MTSTAFAVTQIEALLAGYQTALQGMTDHSDFRISLAGAQEKTVLLWANGQWQLPRGQHRDQL
jgi:serine/threonine-protein kinase HipA